MTDARYIPLGVAIGEPLSALSKRAPGLVRPEAMFDNSPVMVTRLVELTVAVDDKPLLLPPTRFASIEQVAGVVTGLRTAPMVRFGKLKPTNGLAHWLIDHARANGWTVVEQKTVDLDALQAELAKPVRQPARKTYALLRRGDTDLRIVLEESATRPENMKPRSPEPLFLLHTDFTNKPLREAQNTRLFARRRELTGGTQSVLLTAWMR